MKNKTTKNHQPQTETAVFGGGCFWCTEAIFSWLKGVESVTSGYAGGLSPDPSYEQVSTGKTGHAEVVKVEFTPLVIPYRQLVEVFFSTHDPTTPNRQGADAGSQYRSLILFSTPAQEKTAEAVKKELAAKNPAHKPIVTQIQPLKKFYDAESFHQKYFDENPSKPYCQLNILPKLNSLTKKYAHLVKPEYLNQTK